MSWNNFLSMVKPECLKTTYAQDEYDRIKKTCTYVNATFLYRLYDGELSYQEFYKKLKDFFYYDKFICKHGTEFLYLISFKDLTFVAPVYTDVLQVVTPFDKEV